MNTTAIASEPSSLEATINELITLRDDWQEKSPLPPYYPKNAIRIPVACISTVLCNLVDTELRAASRSDKAPADIFVIGNDGAYFEIGDKQWEKSIVDWVDSGSASLTYLFFSPNQPLEQKLAALKKAVSKPEKLNFYTLDTNRSDLPLSVQRLSRRWKTHHFVLGANPKFLWLEGNHPENCSEAENCAYLDRIICESSPDWEIYKTSVDHIKPFLKPILS